MSARRIRRAIGRAIADGHTAAIQAAEPHLMAAATYLLEAHVRAKQDGQDFWAWFDAQGFSLARDEAARWMGAVKAQQKRWAALLRMSPP